MAQEKMPSEFTCRVCNIKFPSTPKSRNQHLNGKKHSLLLPNQITVKGLFNQSDIGEIHNYFATFGKITRKSVKFENGYVLAEYTFEDKKSYTHIIQNNCHRILNVPVEVLWVPNNAHMNKSRKCNLQVVKPNNKVVDTRGVISTASVPSKNSKKAIEAVPETINLDCEDPEEDSPERKKMTPEELKDGVLRAVKEAKNFTASVLILRQKLQENSDEARLDRISIQTDLSMALAGQFHTHKIFFFGSSITGLDITGSDVDIYIANARKHFEPEVATLKKIRMLIYKSKKFCDVLLISGATVPIIKCIHTKTQICCDLNIKNMLSVSNSELIKYYLSLDSKLTHFMMMVKYWADCCGIKKVNLFSSYALCMLVIFYLQQPPFEVPPVFTLQRNVNQNVQDGWNCAFQPLPYLSSKLKEVSMKDLLIGFLRFYANFDYISCAVCPYVGRSVKKIYFLHPCDTLAECYSTYRNYATTKNVALKVSTGYCIQDPFEHTRNLSASMSLYASGKFSALCRNALKLTDGEDPEILYNLLTQFNNDQFLNETSLEVQKLSGIPDEVWFESMKELLDKVLLEVLSCESKQRPPIVQEPDFKQEDTLDHVTYECTSSLNVWENRQSIRRNLIAQLPKGTDSLTFEIAATTCIAKYFPKNLTTKFHMSVIKKKNPSRIKLVLRSNCSKVKHFAHLGNYLLIHVPEWVRFVENSKEQAMAAKPTVVKREAQEVAKKPTEVAIEAPEVATKAPEVATEVEDLTEQIHPEEIRTVKNEEVKKEEKQSSVQEKQSPVQEKPDSSKANDSKGTEEEEDVPADFFDDFANQDFMDGLDIVDAWDEDSAPPVEVDKVEEPPKKKHSPIRVGRRKSSERRRRSKSRSLTRRIRERSISQGRRRRTRSRSRDRNRSDVRRDPEKTKRAIHMDKIKVAKDKEHKIVTDKLSLVETGLVPPGTEMDVDLQTMSSLTARSKERGERGSRDRRRPSRSPLRKIDSRPKRRSNSRGSNISERERWMRARKRSRNRESPPRSKLRKYGDDVGKKKKKSFLEEIREKLNEVARPIGSPYRQAMPYQNTAPLPVPAPNLNIYYMQPTNPSMQQYDQSFFIGENYQANVPGPVFNPVLSHPPVVTVAPVEPPKPSPQAPASAPQKVEAAPRIQTAPVHPPHTGRIELNLPPPKPRKMETSTSDIGKLFADKKISLSDFLTITAKSEASSTNPDHLQRKIKVISRCQDAIRAMTDDRKFSGRQNATETLETGSKQESKYQSPLRRIPVIRFQFTTPSKNVEEQDTFAVALNRILEKIGVIKETVVLDDFEEDYLVDEPQARPKRVALLPTPKKFEAMTCEECKRRKTKVFADVGSQSVEVKNTVSIATQVCEEDISPARGLFKDSLAYLTPAQLLGKRREPETSPTTPTKENNKIPEQMRISPGMDNYRMRDRSYEEFDDGREFFNRSGPGVFPVRPPRQFHQQDLRGRLRDNHNFFEGFRPRNPNMPRFGPRF